MFKLEIDRPILGILRFGRSDLEISIFDLSEYILKMRLDGSEYRVGNSIFGKSNNCQDS